MNTKLNVVSIVLAIFLVTSVRSLRSRPAQVLNQADSKRNNQIVQLLYVTQGQDSAIEENLVSYPLKQFHSACSSANSQRQDLCVEPEPSLVPGSIYLSGNRNTDNQGFPSQKLHSACVSENILRQVSCVG